MAKTPMVLLGERILDGPNDLSPCTTSRAPGGHRAPASPRDAVDSWPSAATPSLENGSAGLRLSGYRQALEAPASRSTPRSSSTSSAGSAASARRRCGRFLEQGVPFDGVVAFNDLIALGAMRVLQEAGVGSPHDVAVIGFDDIDETRYTLPSLSTIDPGREEIAEAACAS